MFFSDGGDFTAWRGDPSKAGMHSTAVGLVSHRDVGHTPYCRKCRQDLDQDQMKKDLILDLEVEVIVDQEEATQDLKMIIQEEIVCLDQNQFLIILENKTEEAITLIILLIAEIDRLILIDQIIVIIVMKT